MYDRVLLPTDGSDANDRAIGQAVGLAQETGADLYVLFVLEDIPYAPETMDKPVAEQLREIGEAALEDIESRAEAVGVDVTAEIREGAPHTAILEYAEEAGVDAVVMALTAAAGWTATCWAASPSGSSGRRTCRCSPSGWRTTDTGYCTRAPVRLHAVVRSIPK